MSFLIAYALFATTTALSSIYELLLPARRILHRMGNDTHPLVQYPLIATLTMFCIGLLLAPLMIFVILIPSLSQNCIEGLCSDPQ